MLPFEYPNWKACWIWQKGDPAKLNTYVYFRRSFLLGVYDPTITQDTGRLINGRVFFDIEAAAGAVIDIGYG